MIQPRRQVPLWVIALLLVVAGHGVLAAIALGWQSPLAQPAQPEPGITLQLAPLPVVTAPAAEPVKAEPVLPKAAPKPVTPAKLKPVARPLATSKPAQIAVKTQPAAEPVRPALASAPEAVVKAEKVSNSPGQAATTWQQRLLSHLARFKRYPDDARRRGVHGMNSLRLVIDGAGHVERFALVAQSGSASLDRATLQMIRRAQPLPAPPAELLEDGRLEVIAPVSYTLDQR